MARTAEKVQSLIEEDESFADALASVKRVAEQNGGEVEWQDVEGEVTSGQWGRLIERGILRSTEGDGFQLADPDGVDQVVGDDGSVEMPESPDSPDSEESSWSQWDKLAGVATLAMMVGYYFNPVRDAIGNTFNTVLGPIDAVLPFYAVVMIVAMLTSVYSMLLQANLMDSEKMSEYQEQMEAIQERRKAAKERGDDEALERIQEEQMEAMGDQLGMFKEQFRPMVWIMVLTIPIFLWLYWMTNTGQIPAAEQTAILPFVGEIEWNEGILGPMPAWIVWYFLSTMGFRQLFAKPLNIQTTPT
ncbi:Uncharacterized membrane protein, DUF106 family [Natronoarchaeum philippinense]|uniref:Uncharacterized membrane protein, DUF106 family n=1 Tax=Natronoarchaeum philippinense TaxID=558529 RepID=A0A285NGP3_NATPI|nr:DUF106 domain-containing protein [Natronoarchaeum philippinense]SNZ06811.1 Uncharacterized membrane protein, DUF106 family [Natronoarchaeum philippinense]